MANVIKMKTPSPAHIATASGDIGNAKIFVNKYIGRLKYSPARGGWLEYAEGIWQRDDLRHSVEHAKTIPADLYLEAASLQIKVAQAAQAGNDAQKKSLQQEIAGMTKRADALCNRSKLEAMLSLASSDEGIAVRERDLDAFDDWLSVQNGVLELSDDIIFRPAHSDDLQTKQANVEFDAGATCPRWLQFLEEVQLDPEVRLWLQKFVGYCLTGRTNEQFFCVFHGLGKNGKTVFAETVKNMLGSYSIAPRFETFCATKDNNIRNDIARLAGSRFAVASEGADGARLDEDMVKRATGGEVLTARLLYQEEFEFTPKFKLLLVTNHKPVINGSDHGIWRRVVLVPWSAQIDEKKVDKNLLEKLKSELPGILNWALNGYAEYRKNGINLPESLKNAVSTYKSDSDVIGQFLTDCTDLTDRNATVTNNDIYFRYSGWSAGNGFRPMSSKTLTDKLKERGFEPYRTERARGWRGIKLLAP